MKLTIVIASILFLFNIKSSVLRFTVVNSDCIISQYQEDHFTCTILIKDSLTHKPIECIVNTSSGLSFYVNENDTLKIPFDCETGNARYSFIVSAAGYKFKAIGLDTNCRDTSFVIYLKQVIKDNNIYDVFPDSLHPRHSIKLYEMYSSKQLTEIINQNSYTSVGEWRIDVKHRKAIKSIRSIKKEDIDEIKYMIYRAGGTIGYVYCKDTSAVLNETYTDDLENNRLYFIGFK